MARERVVPPLADHLAPDTIRQLEQAAAKRFAEADHMKADKRFLTALYLYGYSVEMCLTAAYFRSVGFSPNTAIARDARQRRMAQARQLRTPEGEPLMNSDPHPLVGWARLLERQCHLSQKLSDKQSGLLREAIRNAEVAYKHWRPELRYKVTDPTAEQVDDVYRAAAWFIAQRGKL
jgi:hypothetical protein